MTTVNPQLKHLMPKKIAIPHVCKPDPGCTCDHVAGLETDEACPRHGVGPTNPQCTVCGKYLPVTRRRGSRLIPVPAAPKHHRPIMAGLAVSPGLAHPAYAYSMSV